MTSDHGADRSGPRFDAVLRALRSRVGLTQEQLATRAGVGVRTVRDLERGHVSRPQRTTVELLADALELSEHDRADFLAAARGGPARSPIRRPGHLPPSVDLIGRDADVEQLLRLLTSPLPGGIRGITLVGLTGVGKTSLALAVAHRVGADGHGAVGGITVTDLSTAGDVSTAVAGVGYPDASAVRDPAVDDAALAAVAGYSAVRLFLVRLARVRRAPVDRSEVAPLVALVRRLGGLPLAIELAAARGRVLTIGEILDRYGDRVLDLPGSGAPGPADAGPADAGPAGAGRGDEVVVTLRDAVAASYRLLAPAEQQAVRRLSTLRSRWSLELAEAMIGDGTGDPVPLLDRLSELGLLSARGTGRFRFWLLDVVRDFAAEQAAVEGDLVAARHRHARVMADLAWRSNGDLTGRAPADTASRLDEVSADLAAALSFAAAEDPHTALRIAAALTRWWCFRGRYVTGRRWLRRLLDDPRTADADPGLRGWAMLGLGRLAFEQGEGATEIDPVQAALAAFDRLDLPAGKLAARALLASLWTTTSVGRVPDPRGAVDRPGVVDGNGSGERRG